MTHSPETVTPKTTDDSSAVAEAVAIVDDQLRELIGLPSERSVVARADVETARSAVLSHVHDATMVERLEGLCEVLDGELVPVSTLVDLWLDVRNVLATTN